MITGPLCEAARALVQVSRRKLAVRSNVDLAVIKAFENGSDIPDDATTRALQAALEELGAIFIPEQGALGVGVRLKFSRSVTKRIDIFENEGGPSADDDVR